MGELARKRLRGQGRFQTIKTQRYAFSLSESAYRCVSIIFVLLSLLQRENDLDGKKAVLRFRGQSAAVFLHDAAEHFQLVGLGTGRGSLRLPSRADDVDDDKALPHADQQVDVPPGRVGYKAINTMDSMLGYKNEKYLYFGRIPAKLDDAANYLPSRLAGLLWCAAAALTGNSAKGAWRIWRRDRRNHASPNSAQTESACAGALGVQLAGPAYYFGEYYPKPTIGDALRPIEPEDIRRANKMMYAESLLALLLGLAIRGVIL